ncbi:hypothetical protein [Streptomyces cyaneofuscatus]|uniref:hypothetical protein n=1 Tax=Streptomyces cyaneofuscatus TaxID=66883 RepID=UPI003657A9FD
MATQERASSGSSDDASTGARTGGRAGGPSAGRPSGTTSLSRRRARREQLARLRGNESTLLDRLYGTEFEGYVFPEPHRSLLQYGLHIPGAGGHAVPAFVTTAAIGAGAVLGNHLGGAAQRRRAPASRNSLG